MNYALLPSDLNLNLKHKNPFQVLSDKDLEAIFKNSASDDPSMRSIGYIKMTARKGLSSFQGIHGVVLFCLHPNMDDKYIIFPPSSKEGYEDVKELAKILKTSGKKVEIIRVPSDIAEYAAQKTKGKISEKIDLDYAYPVHVVDVSELFDMRGTRFLKFRNKTNAARKEGNVVVPCDFLPQEIERMKDICRTWSLHLFGQDALSQSEYIDYALNNLTANPAIKGLMSFQNDAPNGFTIWEEPVNGHDTANSLIHCAMHQRGVGELLHHEMAKQLRIKGVQFLSLGGAESKGLDAFKRKMNPVKSISLKTVSF